MTKFNPDLEEPENYLDFKTTMLFLISWLWEKAWVAECLLALLLHQQNMMDLLSHDPKLGHITTFGGHPVIAAACLATLQEITETELMQEALEKEKLFRTLLVHPLIQEIRGKGLMLAAMTQSPEITNSVIFKCQDKGLILFWLLFEGCAIRITPPLTISKEEITEGCGIIT